ncbi:MAG: DUF1049 domain-containing protein [Phascolarctobacterium sp.]|nr:DUF1049 domain-containing protein [Candidatus Phascolarctobacterium equi]
MIYLISTTIICIVVAFLALQNAAAISLNCFFWNFDVPLICVILFAFLAGAVVSSFILMYTKFRHFVADHRSNQEIKRLNKEIAGLKENIALLTEPVKTVNLNQEDLKVEDATVREPAAEDTAKPEQPVVVEEKK